MATMETEGEAMIEDVSRAVCPETAQTYPVKHIPQPERPLIVYENAKGAGETAVQELLLRARLVVPAVMNFLYFSSTHVAVVYLGKHFVNGNPVGIAEGAVDMKIRMIRYLTSEMWPPLLRTDEPDESFGADMGVRPDWSGCLDPPDERDAVWQSSLESRMEVLVYVKNGRDNTRYLKLILRNTTHRLHFDVIDPRDEKRRWEERKLFTRMLDNLETRKAITSYEAYEHMFRTACLMAARLSGGRAFAQERVEVVWHNDDQSKSKPHHHGTDDIVNTSNAVNRSSKRMTTSSSSSSSSSNSSSSNSSGDHHGGVDSQGYSSGLESGRCRHSYEWMENQSRPESAVRDYKSYLFDTAEEMKQNCVRFMCGFLNAYREGRLIIGVHEIPRRNPDGSIPQVSNAHNTIVTHDDLIDQFVIGVRLSEKEVEDIRSSLSAQLLLCVPPVPPHIVRMDITPVRFPHQFTRSKRVLVLYDEEQTAHGSSMKQKAIAAIHQLAPIGLSLVPVESEVLQQRCASERRPVSLFSIAAVQNPEALEKNNWETHLIRNLDAQKAYCRHEIIDDPGDVRVLDLVVVDLSVDLKRNRHVPLLEYNGKFFSGWPSIPIWNTTRQKVGRVRRNYNIFRSLLNAPNSMAEGSMRNSIQLLSDGLVRKTTKSWYADPRIAGVVLSFLDDFRDVMRFRMLHSVWETVFEQRQCTHLLQMLLATRFGNGEFRCSWNVLSWVQNQLREVDMPPMPLLLCRVFEYIGTLPSPYPYVAVPLIQQSFRVSQYLVPIFYEQKYFDGQLKPAIVLDLRDGIVKTMRLRNGNFTIEAVVGVGFKRITRRRLNRFRVRRLMSVEGHLADVDDSIDSEELHGFLTPLTHPRPTNMAATTTAAITDTYIDVENGTRRQRLPSLVLASPKSWKVPKVPRELEQHMPLLSFEFLTAQRQSECVRDFMECRSKPWTLPHLLSWFHLLASDDRIHFFGTCRRSISFRVTSLREVCVDHMECTDGNCPILSEARLAGSPAECLLHQRIAEWASI